MDIGTARLDDLFRVMTPISFKGMGLFLRALSDFDLNAREEAALLASAKMRRDLRNPESDAYLMYLQWLEDASDQSLINIIRMNDSQGFWQESFVEIQPRMIPFQDKATQEEKEQTLADRADELKRTGEARTEFVKAKDASLHEQLKTKSTEELLKLARRAQIEFQSGFVHKRALDAYTLWACVFTDEACTKHYLESPDLANQMEPSARQELLNLYYGQMQRLSELDLKYFLLTDASTDSLQPSKDDENQAAS